MSKDRNPHIGTSLDDFLEEDDVLAEAHAIAVKRALAWQVSRIMAEEKLSKAEMARRMHTSRAALDRFLDPDNPSVTLLTMDKAAAVLGKRLRVEIVDESADRP
ncbi:MAG: Fis family transcriptional regulator [Rhodospirillales bacterium]|jgi:DNA-binding Xre family transcriptional regulator|nr:Fis family transcriptional regulator [Rhodospirillales bacterium]MDP7216558.1 Fis family transcriptional regulator [Rhodospirillales bacterium]HIJ44092.1 XRE family transcriptional regulator [Rhodospirillaceae bacterium]HIJ46025.1 XRE family transcriptional regulator [Rhodospirillaceae bacterium]HIJ93714.1 XRE family transcriptional regulator [Rhodospirillaceae bacterium]